MYDIPIVSSNRPKRFLDRTIWPLQSPLIACDSISKLFHHRRWKDEIGDGYCISMIINRELKALSRKKMPLLVLLLLKKRRVM